MLNSKWRFITVAALILTTLWFSYIPREHNSNIQHEHHLKSHAPFSRQEIIQKLKTEPFDILIIGGGATGAGIALDAANRGYKVALVERFDFGSGTSSKSTKLAHGGVRYLEKAFLEADLQQYDLVKEALTERENLFKIAPHLVKPIEIVIPLYQWWQVPYYWMGLKVYDWIAGSSNILSSEYISPSTVAHKIPLIRNAELTGGLTYYDGQFNDTRLDMSLILSSIALGAYPINYVRMVDFLRDPSTNQILGAKVHDEISQDNFEIYAKQVVNATGPYVDAIRKMDNQQAVPLVAASSGTHLILDHDTLPLSSGLLIPKTADGRVLFMLPWEGHTLIGTTDQTMTLCDHPCPADGDVHYLLSYVNQYFDVSLTSQDVKAVWTGIRPLVKNPKKGNTESLVRDHFIEISPSGLLTITGGKWTTFRKMAEDAVDRLALVEKPPKEHASTLSLRVIGVEGYSPSLSAALQQEFHLDTDVTEHLTADYGGRARELLQSGEASSSNRRLVSNHPILLSEIHWALKEEMSQKPMDILARRTRLAMLDAKAAEEALPQVIAVMKSYLGWTAVEAQQEEEAARQELISMH